MADPELMQVLGGLTGEIGRLSSEVGRLAARQAAVHGDAGGCRGDTTDMGSRSSGAHRGDEAAGTLSDSASSALQDHMRTVRCIVDGQSAVATAMARDRFEMWAHFRELRALLEYVHKDLRERIDACCGSAKR